MRSTISILGAGSCALPGPNSSPRLQRSRSSRVKAFALVMRAPGNPCAPGLEKIVVASELHKACAGRLVVDCCDRMKVTVCEQLCAQNAALCTEGTEQNTGLGQLVVTLAFLSCS